MTPTALSDPIYHNEEAARRHFESLRWPDGPVCFHCGCMDHVRPLNGESMGDGWYYCEDCQDKFTARQGTVLERSHVPIHKWLLAMLLMASSKKGISAHQLHRTLKVTYKTAWFLAHRVREAMKQVNAGPMGGGGKVIEADETYIGRKPGVAISTGGQHKMPVVSLVERGGEVRSFHVDKVSAKTLRDILTGQVRRDTKLMTDQYKAYIGVGREFASHEAVDHGAGEYVRGTVHTNTIENYYSIFKRGMKGVYQHCSEQHLQRYLAEFDFRYSNRAALDIDDAERTTRAIKGATGKRLTYRRINVAA